MTNDKFNRNVELPAGTVSPDAHLLQSSVTALGDELARNAHGRQTRRYQVIQIDAIEPLRTAALPPTPKTIVVTFGGGARDEETFAPEGQRYIPRLLEELIPQATFYRQVVKRCRQRVVISS